MPTVAQDIVAAQPIMMLHTVFRLLGSGRPLFVLRWNCSRVVLHIGFLFGLLIGVTVVVLLFISGGYMTTRGAISYGRTKNYQPVQPIYFSCCGKV